MSDSAPIEGLDPQVVEELRALDGGKGVILGEVLSLFARDTPGRLAQLRAAVSSGDLATIASIAHSLLGSCGSVGAVPMSATCAQLGPSARDGDVAACAGLVERLAREFEVVQRSVPRLSGGDRTTDPQ